MVELLALLAVLALAALVWWLTGSAHPKHDQRSDGTYMEQMK